MCIYYQCVAVAAAAPSEKKRGFFTVKISRTRLLSLPGRRNVYFQFHQNVYVGMYINTYVMPPKHQNFHVIHAIKTAIVQFTLVLRSIKLYSMNFFDNFFSMTSFHNQVKQNFMLILQSPNAAIRMNLR